MKTLTTNQASANFNKLIDDVARSNQPVKILGHIKNAILISEKDWHSIEETLLLTSILGVKEKLENGLNTPIFKCLRKIKW